MDFGTQKLRRQMLVSVISGVLVVGCAQKKASEPQPPAAATDSPATQETPSTAGRPQAMEADLLVLNAKVKAIDKKKRIVTLQYEDGRTAKVKCGPEIRNFPQIRVGDDVTAEFLESIELFVTGPGAEPSTDIATVTKRAPKGAKPGVATATSTEVSATVEDIDYKTRQVTLRGPEGRLFKVKASPEIDRLDEVHKGDKVVARYTEAMAIRVSAPKK